MSGVLVFLHGHDDDADRWRAAAEAMAPTGWAVERPTGPVAVATGDGRAWFGADDDGVPDPDGVHAALAAVDRLVREAAARHGATPAQTALVGFSQGGAVALLHYLGPSGPDGPAAGAVVAVSAWLPDVEGRSPLAAVPGATRLLIAHGSDDETVPLPLGRSVARLLERQGHAVTFVEHDTGHDPMPFAADVRAWLSPPS
jgi:phospholipase/carboxylesterase